MTDLQSPAVHDECILAAFAGERFADEAAVEPLEFGASDVDEAESLISGRPP